MERVHEDRSFYFISGLCSSVLVCALWIGLQPNQTQPQRIPASEKKVATKTFLTDLIEFSKNHESLLIAQRSLASDENTPAVNLDSLQDQRVFSPQPLLSVDNTDLTPAEEHSISAPKTSDNGYVAIQNSRSNVAIPFMGSNVLQEELHAKIQERMDEIKNCYNKASVANPGIQGQLVLSIEVNGEGVVTQSNVSSTKGLPNGIDSCVLEKAINHLSFSKTGRNGAMTYTITL